MNCHILVVFMCAFYCCLSIGAHGSTIAIAALACDLSLAIVSVAAREYLPFGGSKTRHDLKS